MPRNRPMSWPSVEDLPPDERRKALAKYSLDTESKPPRSAALAGLKQHSLYQPSIYRQLEDEIDERDYSNGPVALRADDLRLLVPDRPNAPINADLTGGGSHSRPMRTKIVRSLSDDCHLIDVCDERHDIAIMVACDVIASPNNAPNRRIVLHSAGKTVQQHVISQTVRGESLPMRQVTDASQANYQTVNVDSLADMSGMSPKWIGFTSRIDGTNKVAKVPHGKPLKLSDLRLEFGIDTHRDRSLFARQLEAVIRAIEMAVALKIDLPVEARRYAGLR